MAPCLYTVLQVYNGCPVGVFCHIGSRVHTAGIEPAGIQLGGKHIGRQRPVQQIQFCCAVQGSQIKGVVVVEHLHAAFGSFLGIGTDPVAGFGKFRTAGQSVFGQPADGQVFRPCCGHFVHQGGIAGQNITNVNMYGKEFQSGVPGDSGKGGRGHAHQAEPFDAVVAHGFGFCQCIGDLLRGKGLPQGVNLQSEFHTIFLRWGRFSNRSIAHFPGRCKRIFMIPVSKMKFPLRTSAKIQQNAS